MRVLAEETLEERHGVAERHASALALGYGVVVESGLRDLAVVVHAVSFLESHERGVGIAFLHVCLTEEQVGALTHRVGHFGCVSESGDGAVVLPEAEFSDTEDVGCRRLGGGCGCGEVSAEVRYGAALVAEVEPGLSGDAVSLGGELRHSIGLQRRFGTLCSLAVTPLHEVDLGDVVERCRTELGIRCSVGEITHSLRVVAFGIGDIAHVEACGGAVSAGTRRECAESCLGGRYLREHQC